MRTRSTQSEWEEIFGALASRPRLLILEELRRGPARCQEIQTVVGLSQPAVSYHLTKLERAGILIKERRGASNCYRINSALEGMFRECMKGDGSWRTL